MASVRAAERAAGTSSYQGASARVSHVHTGLGFEISIEIENALSELTSATGPAVVILVGHSLDYLTWY